MKNTNIQTGYQNGIWHRKMCPTHDEMCHRHNEIWKITNNCKNITATTRKDENAWRKGKLKAIGNIRSGHHKNK